LYTLLILYARYLAIFPHSSRGSLSLVKKPANTRLLRSEQLFDEVKKISSLGGQNYGYLLYKSGFKYIQMSRTILLSRKHYYNFVKHTHTLGTGY